MTFCLICISFRFSQQAEKMRNHVVPLHGPKTVRDVYSVRCCTVCIVVRDVCCIDAGHLSSPS
jgi:hypothetical protein